MSSRSEVTIFARRRNDCYHVVMASLQEWTDRTANKLFCWYWLRLPASAREWRMNLLSLSMRWTHRCCFISTPKEMSAARICCRVHWWVIMTFSLTIIYFVFLSSKCLLMLPEPGRQKPWDEVFQCKVLYGTTMTQSWFYRFSNAGVVLNFRSKNLLCCAEWLRWRDFCEHNKHNAAAADVSFE